MPFIVECDKNKAWCTDHEKITTGSAGQTVELRFSDEWAGLSVFAVFHAYDQAYTTFVTGNTVEIPNSVLGKAHVKLFIGLYGINADGSIVIPTVYTCLGNIEPGAEPWSAGNYTRPDMTLYNQMLTLVQAATDAAQTAATGAYAGTVSFSIATTGTNVGKLIMTVTPVSGDPVSTVLGPVTAYAAALAAGYEGTEAEFGELLIANGVAQEEIEQAQADAADAKSDAETALASATTAASNASTALSTANTANTAVAGKQAQHKTATVSLASGQSAWSNLSATGVTASNTVIVTPAPASYAAWVAAGVHCTGQGDGTLSFAASTSTSAALTANVLILD